MDLDAQWTSRFKPWPTIRACLILVAALYIDIALFRYAKTHVQRQSATVFLYVILIVCIWRYVPTPWDRVLYLLIFLVPLAVLLAAFAWISVYGVPK